MPGTRNWRITHSLWVLPTFACGLLTWTSFLYIGLRTKTRAWTLCGVIYLVGAVACFVLMTLSGASKSEVAEGATPPTSTQQAYGDWGAGLMLAIMFGGVVHALLARPHYLYKLAQTELRQQPFVPVYPQVPAYQPAPDWVGADPRQFWGPPAGAPYGHTATGFGQPVGTPQSHAVASGFGQPLGTPATDPYGQPVGTPPGHTVASGFGQPVDTPSGNAAAPWGHASPDPVGSQPPSLAKSPTRIAVNTAGERELATLGLSDAATRAVLAARERSGGFRDVHEFGSVAGLKPHELSRISDRLDFAAPPRAVQNLGRRLDL
ncbi:ComEA family DNA-binding protein [Nocardia lasii]|uniref:Helix-hairpin-helix domain-containing protein n=1 Tax=Nocardia lasii TaxID=1616107 RepID=A0ABW1JKV8_9NOCA